MNRYSIIILLAAGLCWGCDRDKEVIYPEGSLGRYISETGLPTQRDSLIACAASGQESVLQNDLDANVSVFFYPPIGATDFRYFESTERLTDNEYENATYKDLHQEPVLNGYLRRFIADLSDRTCLVTFIKNGKLFISDPITLKADSQPTNINPSGTEITNASSLSPSFTWNPSTNSVDKIYFQIVADTNGNLISGTYTETPSWTFYDLSHVVLNIRDVTPAPILTADQDYKFIMMAVSDDNWVNTIVAEDFRTE